MVGTRVRQGAAPSLDEGLQLVEVNRLENEADAVERTQVGILFAANMEPLSLIKQKEVIEVLEQTTDLCEDVADVLQNVAVKNS